MRPFGELTRLKRNLEIYETMDFVGSGSKTEKSGTGGEPCFRNIPVNGSNGSGGNGGGSGSGGGGTGWSGSNHGATPSRVIVRLSGGRGSVEVGVGVFYMPSDTKKSASARSGGDCPEDELLVPVNEEEETPPSCKSFNYQQGLENTQIAAVRNVSFRVRYLDPNSGDYRMSDVVFKQPIYFTIPRFHTVEGNLTTGRGSELSAKALLNAHSRATAYFLATDGSDSQVRAKLWEYIRDEFKNGSNLNGGNASFTQPLGGFNGPTTNYVTSTFIPDDCD